MQLHIVCGVPIWGDVAGADILQERLSTLILGFLKSGSFIITVKGETTIGAFRGMIPMLWYVEIHAHIIISYSVRLRVARSTVMGTCQSLKKRDEQQIQTLTLLFLYNIVGL